MKLKKLFVLTAALISVAFKPAAQAETPKLVVTILVDQLRYDYLDRFNEQFTTNGFHLFMNDGVFMTFARYNYYPTKTGPGHASYLSGSSPSVHGIIENDWFDKRTRKTMYCCEDKSVQSVGSTTDKGQMSPRNFLGTTVADQMRLHYNSKVISISMKDRGAILPAGKKPAGAYWFESKSGDFITSTYYMKELPAWVKEFNERNLPASFVGKTWSRLLDPKFYTTLDDAPGEAKLAGENKVTFDHVVTPSKSEGFETIMPTPFGNEVLLKLAEAAVDAEKLGQGAQPDMLCVSFSSIDYCGHKFGPYSQEVQDMTLRLDRQLSEFFTFLDKKIGLKNVAVVLTADHGVAPAPEYAAGIMGLDSQRLKEGELMVDLMTKIDEKFGAGKYFLTPKIIEGNLYFNHDTLAEKKIAPTEFCNFIREWALSTGKFIAGYSREQLLDGRAPGQLGEFVLNGYNAERSGDMVILAKPLLVPGGTTGTTHGSPYMYDNHIPVLFYGSMFKPGRYADEFYITDIAATLCSALHIDHPVGSYGKPFVKAIATP